MALFSAKLDLRADSATALLVLATTAARAGIVSADLDGPSKLGLDALLLHEHFVNRPSEMRVRRHGIRQHPANRFRHRLQVLLTRLC